MNKQEELRLQLGEVLPQGIQLMANATKDAGLTINGTVAEMSKMMEDGKLLSKDVLPAFAAQLRKAAQNNGGLEQALLSNRVAMNRMITSTQNAADMIFKSGWEEGLTELFNTIAEVIKENDVLFTEFGKTMGKVFKGFAWIIDSVIAPALSALGSILKFVNDAMDTFGNWVAAALIPLAKFSPILGRIVKHFGGLRGVMSLVAKLAVRMFLPFFVGLAVLEEIAEFFSPTGKKTLIGTNIDKIKNPFESWLRTLDEIVDKFKAFTGNNGTSVQVSSEGAASIPYNMRQMYQPKTQNSQYPAITLQGDVYLDSETVGRQVMRSESAKSAVRYQSGYGVGSNR